MRESEVRTLPCASLFRLIVLDRQVDILCVRGSVGFVGLGQWVWFGWQHHRSYHRRHWNQ